MELNLTRFLESEGKQEKIRIEYGMDHLPLKNRPMALKEPFSMDLLIDMEEKGRIRISGEGQMELEAECDRCLSPVSIGLRIQTDETIEARDIISGSLSEELLYLDGYVIDTDLLIQTAAYTQLPTKILCKEDCKGLCSVCGHNLNEGECGCDRFVPDPRLAVIGELFAKSKEV